MDQNSRDGKNSKMGHYRQHHRSRHPSFSSALLDAICKSTEDEQGRISCSREETRSGDDGKMWRNSSSKRAARVERETQGKPRRSAEIGVQEIESLGASNAFQSFCQTISSAASCSSETSDNTSNWPYSSSDAESVYRPSGKYSATKTAKNSAEKARKWASCMARGREWTEDFHGSSSVKDGGFRSMSGEPFVPEENSKSKKKSKFLKESKKPKQPISPGGKLASFLNSLFMPGSTKKAKLSSSSSVSEANSYYFSQKKAAPSVCSSSSSAQRSCLSKTSSTRGRPGNGMRRSVTFYPTNIVVDDCSPPYCGRMDIPTAPPNPVANPYLSPSTNAFKVNEKLKVQILEKSKQAPSAEEILAKYQKANSILEAVAREFQQDHDDEDDATSCSSSDLFELENLATVDISMFQKELPVYETTHLETNKAIAKGLIV